MAKYRVRVHCEWEDSLVIEADDEDEAYLKAEKQARDLLLSDVHNFYFYPEPCEIDLIEE